MEKDIPSKWTLMWLLSYLTERRDFNPKLIRKDREGHKIFIKGKIHQEDIAVFNICTPHTRTPKFIKENCYSLNHTLILNILIAGDFNTPLRPTDRSST